MSSTKAKGVAAEAIDTSTEVATKGFESTMASVKEGIEKATTGLESSQVKLKESMEKAMRTSEELLAFSQANMEAFMRASKIFAAGLQDITKEVATSNKHSIEHSVSVELQSSFARSSIEKAVSETNKMTDASVRLAEQAMAPLTARLTVAVEKFGKVI
jgi:hypothetical protein